MSAPSSIETSCLEQRKVESYATSCTSWMINLTSQLEEGPKHFRVHPSSRSVSEEGDYRREAEETQGSARYSNV